MIVLNGRKVILMSPREAGERILMFKLLRARTLVMSDYT